MTSSAEHAAMNYVNLWLLIQTLYLCLIAFVGARDEWRDIAPGVGGYFPTKLCFATDVALKEGVPTAFQFPLSGISNIGGYDGTVFLKN
jgi:hypothetical protein